VPGSGGHSRAVISGQQATRQQATGQATSGHGLARRCYERAHPVVWLRWLRVAVLAVIAATALLGWLETVRAHQGIELATTHGVRAVEDVAAARQELLAADRDVQASFVAGAVALTGPGASYTAAIAAAAQDLVLAAGDNMAGRAGSDQIQFAGGQVSAYRSQVEQAGTDFAAGDPVLARAELRYATTVLSASVTGLDQLGLAELDAVNADLGSGWLDPGYLWLLLLAPLAVTLTLAGWTSYVLQAGYRRLLSVPLTVAVITALAFVVLVATANSRDSGHALRFAQQTVAALPGHLAGAPPGPDADIGTSGPTLLAGLALAGSAAALAFAAYRPRLLEYRFPS
jgi:hypothetical protein